MVRQHHAAGADAQALGRRGDLPDHDVGRRACDVGHVVMLGHPVAGEAEPVGETREIDAVAQRLRAGRAGGDGREVEDGQRKHGTQLEHDPEKWKPVFGSDHARGRILAMRLWLAASRSRGGDATSASCRTDRRIRLWPRCACCARAWLWLAAPAGPPAAAEAGRQPRPVRWDRDCGRRFYRGGCWRFGCNDFWRRSRLDRGSNGRRCRGRLGCFVIGCRHCRRLDCGGVGCRGWLRRSRCGFGRRCRCKFDGSCLRRRRCRRSRPGPVRQQAWSAVQPAQSRPKALRAVRPLRGRMPLAMVLPTDRLRQRPPAAAAGFGRLGQRSGRRLRLGGLRADRRLGFDRGDDLILALGRCGLDVGRIRGGARGLGDVLDCGQDDRRGAIDGMRIEVRRRRSDRRGAGDEAQVVQHRHGGRSAAGIPGAGNASASPREPSTPARLRECR